MHNGKRYILHGLAPEQSKYRNPDKVRIEGEPAHYRVDPIETNKALEILLHPYDVKTIGIDIDFTFIRTHCLPSQTYHLDCFMHVLPDGRVLLLNKNIMTAVCFEELKRIFGYKLIDLAINFDKTISIIPFNFLSFNINKQTFIVAPNLTASVENLK